RRRVNRMASTRRSPYRYLRLKRRLAQMTTFSNSDKLLVPYKKLTKSRKGCVRTQIIAGKAEMLIPRSSLANPVRLTAAVVPGRACILRGRQAGGVARCLAPDRLPAAADWSPGVILVASSAHDGGLGQSAALGARFAADAAEDCLNRAISVWVSEGRPPGAL